MGLDAKETRLGCGVMPENEYKPLLIASKSFAIVQLTSDGRPEETELLFSFALGFFVADAGMGFGFGLTFFAGTVGAGVRAVGFDGSLG